MGAIDGQDVSGARTSVNSRWVTGTGPDAAPEAPPPEIIGGRYRIVRTLGEGGFGIVYEAIDERIHKRVAVKVLRRRYAEAPRHVERFRQEAVAAAQLRHPNIVQVSDFATLEEDGRPYLVMEFLDGETLDALLARTHKVSPVVAVRLAIHLCRGLAEAHRNGIIHRDLKPSNVIVNNLDGPTPMVKIVDFGIAKLTDDQLTPSELTTGVVMGTPMYMAPEQIQVRGQLDGRADVYAVGVILYELLTGMAPFHGRTGGDVLVAKATEEPPSPAAFEPWVAPALVKVVMTALRVDRDRRFRSAAAMAEALGQIPDPIARRRPHRAILAGVGLALIAVLTAIAVPRWVRRPTPREVTPAAPMAVPDPGHVAPELPATVPDPAAVPATVPAAPDAGVADAATPTRRRVVRPTRKAEPPAQSPPEDLLWGTKPH